MFDSTYLTDPLAFLVQVVFGFYVLVVVLRFLLQVLRADFYNPLSQFAVRLTTPVLRPLRRIVPGFLGLDVASILLAWVLTAVELALLAAILGAGVHLLAPLAWAVPELLGLVLNVFLFAVIAQALLSWVNPDPYSPAVVVLRDLTRPVLKPLRRVIPPLGGLDLSPMAAAVALVLAKMLLIPPLAKLTGSPF
jgi:YggT family protein